MIGAVAHHRDARSGAFAVFMELAIIRCAIDFALFDMNLAAHHIRCAGILLAERITAGFAAVAGIAAIDIYAAQAAAARRIVRAVGNAALQIGHEKSSFTIQKSLLRKLFCAIFLLLFHRKIDRSEKI